MLGLRRVMFFENESGPPTEYRHRVSGGSFASVEEALKFAKFFAGHEDPESCLFEVYEDDGYDFVTIGENNIDRELTGIIAVREGIAEYEANSSF